MIGPVTALHFASNKEIYLPVTGGGWLLTGPDYPDHAGYNGFEAREDQTAGCFVLVSWCEAISFLVYPASHTYVYYSKFPQKKLGE